MKKIIFSIIVIIALAAALLFPGKYYDYIDENEKVYSKSTKDEGNGVNIDYGESNLAKLVNMYNRGEDLSADTIVYTGDSTEVLEYVLDSRWVTILKDLLGDMLPNKDDVRYRMKDFRILDTSSIIVYPETEEKVGNSVVLDLLNFSFELSDYQVTMYVLVDHDDNSIYGISVRYWPLYDSTEKEIKPCITLEDFQKSVEKFENISMPIVDYKEYYHADSISVFDREQEYSDVYIDVEIEEDLGFDSDVVLSNELNSQDEIEYDTNMYIIENNEFIGEYYDFDYLAISTLRLEINGANVYLDYLYNDVSNEWGLESNTCYTVVLGVSGMTELLIDVYD